MKVNTISSVVNKDCLVTVQAQEIIAHFNYNYSKLELSKS